MFQSKKIKYWKDKSHVFRLLTSTFEMNDYKYKIIKENDKSVSIDVNIPINELKYFLIKYGLRHKYMNQSAWAVNNKYEEYPIIIVECKE